MAKPAWRLDPAAGTVERLTDSPITFNAIAKGFILDLAADRAFGPDRGVSGVLLNAGGDLKARGDSARILGIASPFADSETTEPIAFVEVRDRAVSTSGRSQRGFSIGGRWYSHIFDPRTGRPVETTVAATVIADRSADADALATIFNVLGVEDSLRLANALPGVACLLVTSDGRTFPSDGWAGFERPRPPAKDLAMAQAPKAKDEPRPKEEPKAPKVKDEPKGKAAAPGEYELLVKFEINKPDGEARRYRRPYVAIWIEDKDGFPVRNLTLWVSQGGAGPGQWLPDLKRWYRSDQARRLVDNVDMLPTISRPTRMPGEYSVIWDGKDDKGKTVPPGEYTLFIDAAREHGTYQNIRKTIQVGDKPFVEELKGNVEIKSAALEYRRKAPAK